MNENYSENLNETMNLGDEGTCEKVAKKIKEIRGGNRLMAANDMNVTLSFYRRDTPEKKCGVLKLSGVYDFSLLDAGIALGAAVLLCNILGTVVSLIRRMR